MRSEFTQHDLQDLARRSIRAEAQHDGRRARCLGWKLAITEDDRVLLIAYGIVTSAAFRQGDKGYQFTVQTAI